MYEYMIKISNILYQLFALGYFDDASSRNTEITFFNIDVG